MAASASLSLHCGGPPEGGRPQDRVPEALLKAPGERRSLREERDGSWLGPLVKLALVVGVILLVLSLVAHILHFLFVVAIGANALVGRLGGLSTIRQR